MFIIHYCAVEQPETRLTFECEGIAAAKAVYAHLQQDAAYRLLCTAPVDMDLFDDMVKFFFGAAYDRRCNPQAN